MELKDIKHSKDDKNILPNKRKVGFLLGIGIFFIPYLFSWLTLRKGFSVTARYISFSWLTVIFILGLIDSDDKKSINTESIEKKYRILEIKKLDYRHKGEIVKRRLARVIIEKELSKKELEEQINNIILEVRESEQNPNAIRLALFKAGNSTNGASNVATAIWGPDGKWEDANLNKKNKTTIEFSSSYFKKKDKPFKQGDIVSLKKEVIISKYPNQWNTGILKTTKKIEHNVKVIKKKEYPLSNPYPPIIRYEIQFKGIKGWISSYDIVKEQKRIKSINKKESNKDISKSLKSPHKDSITSSSHDNFKYNLKKAINLGDLLNKGKQFEKKGNLRKAEELYKKGCNNGNKHSCDALANIGTKYFLKQKKKDAKRSFNNSCKMGSSLGCSYLTDFFNN